MAFDFAEYACRFIGRPYIWGGDGSGKCGGGFDCSGLVLEALKAAGYIEGGLDFTAQGLHDALKKRGWVDVPPELITAQDVLFWGKSAAKITHTAIAIDRTRFVEAGGGGSKCTSPEKSTGMIRVRPLGVREAPVAILRAPV